MGTTAFLAALARIDDETLSRPTALTAWTGRHLVAHVASNADALLNLAHWASTGLETPMYASPDQRAADIERGAERSPGDLRRWVDVSAAGLASALTALSAEQWSREVRTAQGRLLPATEIPWLRAREVMVHAVDLDPALGLENLPVDFLLALIEDVVAKRSVVGGHPALELEAVDGPNWTITGVGEPTRLRGSVAGIAAYLTGRRGADLVASAAEPPALPPWL